MARTAYTTSLMGDLQSQQFTCYVLACAPNVPNGSVDRILCRVVFPQMSRLLAPARV
jgi:hypothetical protein